MTSVLDVGNIVNMDTANIENPLKRFKDLEHSFRTYLPENSYAVIRVDGKSFSKYTSKMVKPFDSDFTRNMQETAKYLVEQVEGAIYAYTQSDEISIVLSDLKSERAQWWHGGQVQKLVSITAAEATAKFNSLYPEKKHFGVFDGRTHTLDDLNDVFHYLCWRQADAIKNSVGMLAAHHFSHRSLLGVSTRERRERLDEAGHPWMSLPPAVRQGSLVKKGKATETLRFFHNKEKAYKEITAVRHPWILTPAPLFARDGI